MKKIRLNLIQEVQAAIHVLIENTLQDSIGLDELDSGRSRQETVAQHANTIVLEHGDPRIAVRASPLVSWNGMPWYSLTLDAFSILIAACFFSKVLFDKRRGQHGVRVEN
jgi:hypothetical protein